MNKYTLSNFRLIGEIRPWEITKDEIVNYKSLSSEDNSLSDEVIENLTTIATALKEVMSRRTNSTTPHSFIAKISVAPQLIDLFFKLMRTGIPNDSLVRFSFHDKTIISAVTHEGATIPFCIGASDSQNALDIFDMKFKEDGTFPSSVTFSTDDTPVLSLSLPEQTKSRVIDLGRIIKGNVELLPVRKSYAFIFLRASIVPAWPSLLTFDVEVKNPLRPRNIAEILAANKHYIINESTKECVLEVVNEDRLFKNWYEVTPVGEDGQKKLSEEIKTTRGIWRIHSEYDAPPGVVSIQKDDGFDSLEWGVDTFHTLKFSPVNRKKKASSLYEMELEKSFWHISPYKNTGLFTIALVRPRLNYKREQIGFDDYLLYDSHRWDSPGIDSFSTERTISLSGAELDSKYLWRIIPS